MPESTRSAIVTKQCSRGITYFGAIIMAAAIIGCGSTGRSTIKIPSVDSTAAAKSALELYDKDGSGALDAAELAACPGMLAAMKRYDTNGDGQVSGEEVAAHLASLYSNGVGLTVVNCRVIAGTRLVAGAKVRFVPEPFLAGAVLSAAGTTGENGSAIIAIEDEALPADQRALRSMQPGIYRVHIEHASFKQPPTLGCEIDPAARGGTEPVFHL
jgi:EF hand domain-containing protein